MQEELRAVMSVVSALPATMAAVTQQRYGPPQVLRLSTVNRPVPRPDEVLLAVHAAGVSRGVWHMTTGRPRLVRLIGGVRRPRQATPGMDVCGHVVQVGSGVSSLRVGQRVFGIARGSFAEYAVAKANISRVNSTCTRTARAVFCGGCFKSHCCLASLMQQFSMRLRSS